MIKLILWTVFGAAVFGTVCAGSEEVCGKNSHSGCGQNCGRRCSDYPPGSTRVTFACPDICKVYGCDCDPGYVFDNHTRSCVVPNDCTIKALDCSGKNEIYEICPAKCPPGVCGIDDRLIDCAASPQIGDADCAPPACKCKFGFYRNDKKKCVKFEQCPKCDARPNEVYEPCPQLCPPKRCDVDERIIRCAAPPQLGDADCKPGCQCIEGYKRNSTGICIPKDQCEPFCGENEEASDCIDGGCFSARYCSQKGRPEICVNLIEGACKKGCICKKGYLRDELSGQCVLEDKCPETPKCEGKNQVFDYCPAGCPPRDCSVNDALIKCAAPPQLGDPECNPGCRCADGYKTNKTGDCIPENQCDPFCGENEEASNCTNGGCFGARYCSQKGRPEICVDLIEGACKKGCICKKGYLRDELSGQCVLEDKCPEIPKCEDKNQVFDYCPAGCPPRDCSVNDALIKCAAPPQLGDPECNPGCRCTDGYKTNKTGDCIPENQCEPFCSKNEVPSNCTNGGCFGAKFCSQKGAPIKCVKLDPDSCIKGCLCKEGHLRNELTGICVKEDKCPETPKCEEPNTVFDYCPALCPPRRCDVNDALIFCIKSPQLGDPECKPGCRCADGYKKNKEGVCISEDKCPPFCGANAEPSDCINGGCWSARNCSEIGEPVKCTKIPEGSCIKGCLCKDGYLLNEETLECVPESECPNGENKCNRPNEIYQVCPRNCPPQTCESINKKYNCPLFTSPSITCRGACVCKPGFYKNKNGDCISKENCLKCTGPHEFYSCGGACDNVCADLNVQNQTNCPIINIKCNEMCYCENGYARNNRGICIPFKDCPPPHQDEKKCTRPNEIYQVCPRNCPPQTCESINKKYNCPLSTSPSITCRGACVCKPGFYKNKNGECISKGNCLKCTGPHEFYSCGGACDNVCADLNVQNQTNCPIINIKCNEMCYCENGYARNNRGICIPIKDCPPSHQDTCSGPNEFYDKCAPQCSPQSCSSLVGPRPQCLPIAPGECFGACRCKEGFYRNDELICIPKEECQLCPQKNEEYNDCPPNCTPDTCASLYVDHSDCVAPAVCLPACRCKKGHYRNEDGDCIPVDQCPCKIGDTYVADDGCNTCDCTEGTRGTSICSASFAPCDLTAPVEPIPAALPSIPAALP